MSKPNAGRFIVQKNIATSSAVVNSTQPGQTIVDQGLPTGDEGIYELMLRYFGNLNLSTASAGTIVTNGSEINIRLLQIETDKHGILAAGLDGLALFRMQQYEDHSLPDDVTISAATTGTPAFRTTLRFKFALDDFLRPYDTLLDMMNSRMTIRFQIGINTDFISGGTYTTEDIQVANLNVDALTIKNPNSVDNPPEGITSEMPIFQRSVEMLKVPINATATNFKIPLPYGDRIYRRIYVCQRNGSTFAELATVIVSTGNIGIEVNGFPWMQLLPLADIQAWNKSVFETETLPTGIGVLDWGRSGRIADFLSVLDTASGSMNLVADVTSVTNGQLWIILDCLKPIPAAARRSVSIIRQ